MTLICAAAALALPFRLGAQPSLADLNEDVRGLKERVNDLSLQVEQLQRENADLRAKLASGGSQRDAVNAAQLNGAVGDLNASIKSQVAASREEILQKVAAQMENLAKQTNAAIDSVSRQPAEPQARASLADDHSRPGVTYTVQKGDTVELIAKKTGARFQDIVSANKLADPSRIRIGQTLFVPGGKAPANP
ncbi:MAG TPA: LysM peptidoglycan-binding domain-containing protein [Opitutaceae bacterium]